MPERQLTFAPHGHVLTHVNVWSPDGQWIIYDTRPDPAGSIFEGDRIERVNVRTGEVQLLYRSTNGAKCGVVTHHPEADEIVFILGPERPTPDWQYGPSRRQGVTLKIGTGTISPLDARDLVPPFTRGALRGGSHVHVFSPDGRFVNFTYNDQVVATDQRNVGVCVLNRPVSVKPAHPRNHDGRAFSVLVTRTTADPRPGSDEIRRAYEDAWVGPDGRAIAFIGETLDDDGRPLPELFVVDLSPDLTRAGADPLEGTATTLPAPPRGTVQRRLTRTARRLHPGPCSPRHWVRSSPDGTHIAFLMKDDDGVGQIWTVSPAGGEPAQLTRNAYAITSSFTWSPDGRRIAHAMDGSVCATDTATGRTCRITEQSASSPRPEACVFSPDGERVAFTRVVNGFNQIFVATINAKNPSR
jgi:hypothetical protein